MDTADSDRNASTAEAEARVPAPIIDDPTFTVYPFDTRDGDILRVEYAFAFPYHTKWGEYDRYWLTDPDGHILGGGKCLHERRRIVFLTWQPGQRYLDRAAREGPTGRPAPHPGMPGVGPAGTDAPGVALPRRNPGRVEGAASPAPAGTGGADRGDAAGRPGAAGGGDGRAGDVPSWTDWEVDADHGHARPFIHTHTHYHERGDAIARGTHGHEHSTIDHHPV